MNMQTHSAWADARKTHPAVAVAIHLLAAGRGRTPDDIWSDPTPHELARVRAVIRACIAAGACAPEPDGRYPWGCETLILEN